MDSKFLEFWGNYMLAAARGQKQLEDLNKWINQGFSGFKELSALFEKYYGLETSRPKNRESADAWQSAAACFRDSYEAYLNMIGAVPKEKCRQLEQKLSDIEQKVAERDETITILRNLLAEKGTYQGETVKALQDLVNKQAGAFESFMKSISGAGKEGNER